MPDEQKSLVQATQKQIATPAVAATAPPAFSYVPPLQPTFFPNQPPATNAPLVSEPQNAQHVDHITAGVAQVSVSSPTLTPSTEANVVASTESLPANLAPPLVPNVAAPQQPQTVFTENSQINPNQAIGGTSSITELFSSVPASNASPTLMESFANSSPAVFNPAAVPQSM